MIETDRLILRAWRDADREPFAAINADPRIGYWLGGVRTRAESDEMVDRFNTHIEKHGYGPWALERKSDRAMVGMIGLHHLAEIPGPAIEMAWRLSPDSQGAGLASEGSRAALAWGWANLHVVEIIAFTAQSNLRSQAVMHRIGMIPDPTRDFIHPRLPQGHLLASHVMFVAKRP